jgi:hypothetical protein
VCSFGHYNHHVQHLSSGGGAEVLPVPSGDGFEAENSINFLIIKIIIIIIIKIIIIII